MPLAPARLALLLSLLLVQLPAAEAGAAAGYVLRQVAIEGNPAPGAGDHFGTFVDVTLNELGHVAFSVPLESGFPAAGVFVDTGSGPELRMRNGDPAPAPLPGGYRVFGAFAHLDGSSRLAIPAITLDESTVETAHGLFLDVAGSDSVLVAQGDPTPNPPAGTVDAQIFETGFFGMNPAGDVAFESTVAGGSVGRGLFLRGSGGALVLRVGEGATPQGGGPETFSDFDYPALNAGGRVAFVGFLAGGTPTTGLFTSDAGSAPATLAVDGDAAPGTGGGSFDDFFLPALNAAGEVAFMSNVSGGTASGGLFLAEPAVSALVVEGDVVPGAGPIGTIHSLPEIASDGTVGMSLGFASGPVANGVYLRAPNGDMTPVVETGEIAPHSGGTTFQSFGYLDMNDADQVAFVATLADGRSAIYLATPGVTPKIPALPAAALPLLGVVFAIVAGRSLARSRSS